MTGFAPFTTIMSTTTAMETQTNFMLVPWYCAVICDADCCVVQAALADLHVMPTLDCLALSQDPAIRARAAAALAALVTAGNLEVEEASGRWTDMLLSWLISSTVTVLQKRESSSGGGSSSSGWLLGGLFSSSSSSDGGDVTGSAASGGRGDVGDEALARSCVAALRGKINSAADNMIIMHKVTGLRL